MPNINPPTLAEFQTNLKDYGVVSANRFSVYITPKPNVIDSNGMEYRIKAVNIPAMNITTDDFKLNGAMPVLKVPKSRGYSNLTITFLCSKDFHEKMSFENWLDKIIDFQTNRTSYYNDVCTDIIINIYNNMQPEVTEAIYYGTGDGYNTKPVPSVPLGFDPVTGVTKINKNTFKNIAKKISKIAPIASAIGSTITKTSIAARIANVTNRANNTLSLANKTASGVGKITRLGRARLPESVVGIGSAAGLPTGDLQNKISQARTLESGLRQIIDILGTNISPVTRGPKPPMPPDPERKENNFMANAIESLPPQSPVVKPLYSLKVIGAIPVSINDKSLKWDNYNELLEFTVEFSFEQLSLEATSTEAWFPDNTPTFDSATGNMLPDKSKGTFGSVRKIMN